MERCYKLDLLGDNNDQTLCFLSNHVEDLGLLDIALRRGDKLGKKFPADARIDMDADHPGKKLSSLIGNTNGLIIVSRELKDVFEKHCGANAEYLPVAIHDHRKRLASKDYFLINALKTVDCLDPKKSTIEWNPADPERIMHIGAYVIDRKKLKNAPPLFRLHKSQSDFLLTYDLALEIKNGGFTNVFWEKLPFSDE